MAKIKSNYQNKGVIVHKDPHSCHSGVIEIQDYDNTDPLREIAEQFLNSRQTPNLISFLSCPEPEQTPVEFDFAYDACSGVFYATCVHP